jgi:hypothetical protein
MLPKKSQSPSPAFQRSMPVKGTGWTASRAPLDDSQLKSQALSTYRSHTRVICPARAVNKHSETLQEAWATGDRGQGSWFCSKLSTEKDELVEDGSLGKNLATGLMFSCPRFSCRIPERLCQKREPSKASMSNLITLGLPEEKERRYSPSHKNLAAEPGLELLFLLGATFLMQMISFPC